MNYLSLFSGVGGFELGIQRAFDASTRQLQPQGGRRNGNPQEETKADSSSTTSEGGSDPSVICIGYSEIDKYAIATYEHNWGKYEEDNPKVARLEAEQEIAGVQKIQPSHKSGDGRQFPDGNRKRGHRNYGSATTINERELPDFELLVGGFPCQAFSIAGKRKGFDEARGTLFFDIARILAYKRPRHFLLENVKGLLSHDGGKTIQTIASVLTDLGYRIEWQVLNAKDFGVPQNRERIFIVGHLGGECGRQVFPIRNLQQDANPVTITPGWTESESSVSTALATKQYRTEQTYINVVGTLDTNGWEKRNESIRRVHGIDGIAPTTPTGTGGGVMTKIATDARIRRLTPTECERLMSWPDSWTIGSDTQRYKQCGNGVVSNVVQAVIEKMMPCLV